MKRDELIRDLIDKVKQLTFSENLLRGITVKQLKQLFRENKLRGSKRSTKANIIDRLLNAQYVQFKIGSYLQRCLVRTN